MSRGAALLLLLAVAVPAQRADGRTPARAAPADQPDHSDQDAGDEEAWYAPGLADECSRAAARGLAFLASRQLGSGAWPGYVGHKQGDNYQLLGNALLPDEQRATGEGHLGVTALCGMAFLAGGHLPDRGEHRDVVCRAQDFVVAHALENGLLTAAGTRMYSHAFATLFLAEVHGMGAHDEVKATLERAVNLIVDCQNQHGGWRYNPFDRETDLSVTVCQLQALRAARNIGIRVPPATIDRAIAYVRESRVARGPSSGLFYYKIHGRGAYEKDREYAINAAALTALSSAGIHDDELSAPVLDFLDGGYRRLRGRGYATHFYYWYGNYYAAQAFYQHGGPRLRAFFGQLARDLLDMQGPDGRWRNTVGPGDELATAVACILLQMPKQYLPIFQR